MSQDNIKSFMKKNTINFYTNLSFTQILRCNSETILSVQQIAWKLTLFRLIKNITIQYTSTSNMVNDPLRPIINGQVPR